MENAVNSCAELLYAAVLELKTPAECRDFFADLCSKQELRAMAQRLAVAGMLEQQKSYEEIVKATGVSTATVSRVKRSSAHARAILRRTAAWER